LAPPFCAKDRALIAARLDESAAEAAQPPTRDAESGKLQEVARAQRWTLRKLVGWVHTNLGIDCVRETLRGVLLELKMSWKQGKKLLSRGSASAREAFVATLQYLLRRAHAGIEKLVYIDEAHIHQDADQGHTWSRRGEPYFVASTSPGLARVSFFGAYVYNDTKIAIFPAERANSDTASDFLQTLREAYPHDRIRVVWDGARYHCSEEMRETAKRLGIRLTPLPPYSPDFMPVEALWRWLREEVTYNHCHATAEELIAAVSAFADMANQDPDEIITRLALKKYLDSKQEKLRLP